MHLSQAPNRNNDTQIGIGFSFRSCPPYHKRVKYYNDKVIRAHTTNNNKVNELMN